MGLIRRGDASDGVNRKLEQNKVRTHGAFPYLRSLDRGFARPTVLCNFKFRGYKIGIFGAGLFSEVTVIEKWSERADLVPSTLHER